mmetsp:Transcript_122827/g.393465  ORF Transcript_122827/g.393465 Transcript_122827/m.393465 type:complete len:232 (-) Transcript_122827:555-1250(-)
MEAKRSRMLLDREAHRGEGREAGDRLGGGGRRGKQCRPCPGARLRGPELAVGQARALASFGFAAAAQQQYAEAQPEAEAGQRQRRHQLPGREGAESEATSTALTLVCQAIGLEELSLRNVRVSVRVQVVERFEAPFEVRPPHVAPRPKRHLPLQRLPRSCRRRSRNPWPLRHKGVFVRAARPRSLGAAGLAELALGPLAEDPGFLARFQVVISFATVGHHRAGVHARIVHL